MKALQGRKSDRRDAKRIAEYLQDGRLDPSFVPPHEIRELRQLLRHRLSLLQQRGESHNQIRDLFETANIKLSSVASNLLGLTGRCIIEAMIAGEDSPDLLAWKVKGKLRKKEKQVKESLKGCFNEFHRTMLKTHYALYQFLTRQVEELEAEIARRMLPYAEQVNALAHDSGSGEDRGVASDRGVGRDDVGVSRRRPLRQLGGGESWKLRKRGQAVEQPHQEGKKYLRRILTQSAWAASHCKQGYLRAFFHRVKARRGWARAVIAVAHKILVIAYCVLKTGTKYQDLGDDYFDKLHPQRTAKRLVQRLERLGLTVSVAPTDLNSRFQES